MRLLDGSRARKAALTTVVLLIACTPGAPTTTVRPPTTSPATAPTQTTAAASAAPTRSPSEVPSATAAPAQTSTPAATSSPAAGDDLAALFASLAPVLAVFTPGAPQISTGEDVIARLEDAKEMLPEPVHVQVDAEIARYEANGLLERGTVALGTTPAATLTVDRFISEAGAAADFPIRGPSGSCDAVTLPGAPLVDVIAKRCNSPDGNDVYVVGHRGDLIVTVQVLGVDDESIDPVVSTLVGVFRAVEPALTR